MEGFEEELEEPETEVAKWLKRIGITALVLLVLAGIGMMVKSLMLGQPSNKKNATMIRIVVPDMPPPPPPPKEQPKEQEQPKEIKIEQPKPQEAPQPAAELKMEGPAGNGDSPFAAGPVKNDFIGGKVGLSAYRWYTDQIVSRIEEALSAQKELAKARYSLVVHIWLARDGKIERAELQGSSGDLQTDERIRKALAAMEPIAEVPPGDMPQPVKLRINSK